MEPQRWHDAIVKSLEFCIGFDTFMNPSIEASCDIFLPLSTVAEREGTVFTHYAPCTVTAGFMHKAIDCGNLPSDMELAYRLGKYLHPERFEKWANEHELYDWRLAPLGLTWEDACARAPEPLLRELAAPGRFVTPSGKVELASSVLAELGFDEVSTASYEYRSEVMDQMLNLVTQREDTVAYTLARKRVTGADGSTRSVILVSVRGSYGSEWLSNLKIEGVSPEGETALSEDQETRYDHSGYVEAASEVSQAVAPWVRESHRRGDQVTLLLVGHSRGGAIANLVAAQADDELAALAEGAQPQDGLELAAGDAVAGYTFASPGCTTSTHAHAARYGNIFNIVNPADLMPVLPLASWGYARYGVDMNLPAMDEEGFDTQFTSMSSAYTELTGEEDPYDPEADQAVRLVVGEVGAEVGSVDELVTPGGIAAVAQACARHIDPTRILCGHYPSVYISWMYTIEADDLTLS